jgi:hypothetical protein
LKALAGNDTAMVETKAVVAGKLVEGRVQAGNGRRGPSQAGSKVGEQSGRVGVGSIGRIPSGGRWKGLAGRGDTASKVGSGGGWCGRVLKEG